MNARGLRHKTGNLRNMRCSEKECHGVAGLRRGYKVAEANAKEIDEDMKRDLVSMLE